MPSRSPSVLVTVSPVCRWAVFDAGLRSMIVLNVSGTTIPPDVSRSTSTSSTPALPGVEGTKGPLSYRYLSAATSKACRTSRPSRPEYNVRNR